MGQEFYLSDDDVRYQRGVNKRVNGGRTSQRPGARRRRGPQGGGGGKKTGDAKLYKVTQQITALTVVSGKQVAGKGTGVLLVPVEPQTNPPSWQDSTNPEDVKDLFNSVAETIAVGKVVQLKMIDGFRFVDVVDCT
jgi:hypothetical protein